MLKNGIANQTLFYIALAVLILGAIGYYLQFYTDVNFSPVSTDDGSDRGVITTQSSLLGCPSFNVFLADGSGRSGETRGHCTGSFEECERILRCFDPYQFSPLAQIARSQAMAECQAEVSSIISSHQCEPADPPCQKIVHGNSSIPGTPTCDSACTGVAVLVPFLEDPEVPDAWTCREAWECIATSRFEINCLLYP